MSNLNDPLFVVDGAKLTLNGEGSVSANGSIATVYNGGEVIVDSGTYNSGYEAFKAIGAGSKITMNDGELTSQECALGVNEGAEIELNGGVIHTNDDMGIGTDESAGQGGNTITMNGGVIDASVASAGYEAVGVYIANDDTFVMNGGSIIANNGAGICMRAGDVTINDGSITSTGEAGTTGKIGDGDFQMGKSAIIYHESANYPGKAGMKLTVTGGTITGVDHSIEVLSNEAEPQVFVSGGTFVPDYPESGE